MKASQTGRALICILLAITIFMLKGSYSGPHAVIVMSYLGNVSISFAVYFLGTIPLGRILARRLGRARLFAAAASLLAVEAFELSDGFGVMSNVYDPFDLLANAIGVGLGFSLDSIISRRKGTWDAVGHA